MERENIISKIQKLLNLANNKGATEAEAVQAALQAQRLIAKHNVSDNELNAAAEAAKESVINLETERRYKRPWHRELAAVVAENFRCKHYMRGNSQRGYSMVFLGYESDAKAAELTFDMLQKVCTRKGNAYARERIAELEHELASELRCYGYSTVYVPTKTAITNTYSSGFIAGVKDELEKQSVALMLVCPAEVREEYANMTFRTMRNARRTGTTGEDRARGRNDGRSAVTSHRMNGQKALVA